MAIRRFGVDLGRGLPVAEAADITATELTAVDDAIALAVANGTISGDVTAAGLVDDIQTAADAVGVSQGTAHVRVLVDSAGTPTKANVREALLAVLAHIEASDIYV